MMRSTLLAGGALVAAVAHAGARLPRPDDPSHFTPADKQAMLQLVRRAVAAKGDLAFSPATMPAKLLRSTGRPVFVSAHRPGRGPLVAVRANGTLFAQLTAAARELCASPGLGPLGTVRLKIDVVDHVAPMDAALLGGSLALGIHGLHVRTPQRERYLLPSEALRLDLHTPEAVVRHALRDVETGPDGLAGVAIERFTTVSFIERRPGGGGAPVDLYRGMPLVERLTHRRLLAACEAAADWLLRVQKPDGSFHYLYRAATDKLEGGYCVVRHAGTAWSLAQACRATRHPRFLDATRRALRWLLGRVRTRGEMAWIEHEGRQPLGAAALAVVALLEFRTAAETPRHDAVVRKLGRFLVFMQRPDGFFWSDYDPKAHRGIIPKGHVPLFSPGEAFLALVRLRRALPDPLWQRATANAADFAATRRDAWYAAHDLAAIQPDAWTLMAIDELHAAGAARRVHLDYAFFLAKAALDEQETPATARWRDHAGAPREPHGPPRVTPAACRCEALLAAWRLARRMGLDATDYRRAVLRSARFQLAHQYGPVNSYLLPNPARARGAFYSSYAHHSTRIDVVQHNLSALLGAAALLAAEGE